jgi:hypothetical protein
MNLLLIALTAPKKARKPLKNFKCSSSKRRPGKIAGDYPFNSDQNAIFPVQLARGE